MSIAQHSYTLPSSPRLHPVYVEHLDPAHDIVLTIVAADDAPTGQITVYLDRGPFGLDAIDATEYVNAIRRFADHLQAYADDYAFAASLDR